MMLVSAGAIVAYSWQFGPHQSIERAVSNFNSRIVDLSAATPGAITGGGIETDITARNISPWCALSKCPTLTAESTVPVRFQYVGPAIQVALSSVGYQIEFDDGWYLASGTSNQFRFRTSPSQDGDGTVIEWIGTAR
jgi:hypothetical protein